MMLDFIKHNWVWMSIALLVLFVVVRTKIRGYFFRVRKTGEEVKFKDFFKLWGRGIEGITPLQQAKSQVWGMWITLTGMLSGLIINILVRVEYQWIWLVIVLSGSLIIGTINQVGFLQKYWRIKKIEEQVKELESG